MTQQLAQTEARPEDSTLTPEQLTTDLARLQDLVRHRPADGEPQLEQLSHRYKVIPKPPRHVA